MRFQVFTLAGDCREEAVAVKQTFSLLLLVCKHIGLLGALQASVPMRGLPSERDMVRPGRSKVDHKSTTCMRSRTSTEFFVLSLSDETFLTFARMSHALAAGAPARAPPLRRRRQRIGKHLLLLKEMTSFALRPPFFFSWETA